MDQLTLFAILWVSLALFTAVLISKLMKLIHFPNVTGFLIGGIIIGPWVLGLLIKQISGGTEYISTILSNISWISEIALGFIAFTIGGSFKISALKKVGKRATVISIAEALGGSLVVIAALFIGYFCGLKNCGLTIPMILILGAIACATAPAATLLVINQYKARGQVTETLIPVVAFDDAVALIAFSILFSIAKIVQLGGSFDPIKALLIPFLEIVISLVVGAIIGFAVSFGTRWFKSRHNRLVLIIAAVLLGVGISQIDTASLGWGFSFQTSSLLTVMAIGGVYANLAKGSSTTNEFLDKFTQPIFMLFFVISGAKLNFGVFGEEGAWIVIVIAGIYLITRVIGKWAGAAFGSKVTKCPPTVQKYLGFTLVPQAGVALGLAANSQTFFVGLDNPVGTNPEAAKLGLLIYTIIIVSTMVYELTGPLITKWALTKAGEIQPEVK